MMTAQRTLTLALVFSGALGAGTALAQPTTPAKPAAPAKPTVAPQPPAAAKEAMDVDLAVLLASQAAGMVDLQMDLHKGLIIDAEALAHEAMFMLDASPHLFEFDLQDRKIAAEDRAKSREAESQEREREREMRVYDDAMKQIYDSRWDRAVERFNDVITMKGTKVDAALYWKAYAQDRQGLRTEALTTLGTLTREHASSRYLQQARALEAEVRRNAGQPVRPQDQADEDLKLIAIAALQNSAPEQAIPMLEKLLAGTASPKLKERALFVLAQSDSPRAREVLAGVAKGNSTPELQSRAITYLGMHGGRESHAILAEIYSSTTDVDSKKRIIRALAMGGEKDRVFAAAQSEQNPELRAEAVRQLGMHGAHAELSQLYAKETSAEIKRQIISAMAMSGNSTRLVEIAKSEQNPELRRSAIRGLGMTGGNGTGDTLVEIYSSERDTDVKKTVISSLAMQGNAAALVALARKEPNTSELKRDIVSRLSQMDSKIATDYLLEIINK
ncbi:MAG TPA: HEAT repeat domain-containing protein [Vicinamibacterales bacterium]|jgi:HEAT repeat protein|nr:HEAT repeat domain-containing protein [Vicinamibacterales bacterium]